MEELRTSRPGDEPALKALWKTAFGDADEVIDGFFETLYAPGTASVCLLNGRPVSAAYLFRLGDLVCDGRWTPCKLLYAWGTDPAFRGRGFGKRVLENALERAAVSGVTALCPGSPAFFDRFRDRGFRTTFYAREERRDDDGRPLSGTVTRVTVRGYAALREELLHRRTHIDLDIRAVEYRDRLCRASGGGLFYVVADGARCCAAAELAGDEALIRELIVPAGREDDAAALVCRALRRKKYTFRAPAGETGAGAPSAMLSAPLPPSPDPAPWLGFDWPWQNFTDK